MSIRNVEVVRAFLSGQEKRSANLQTDGAVLMSYGKAVAVRRSRTESETEAGTGAVVEYLNNVVGSRTTADHLSLLRRQIRAVQREAAVVIV